MDSIESEDDEMEEDDNQPSTSHQADQRDLEHQKIRLAKIMSSTEKKKKAAERKRKSLQNEGLVDLNFSLNF